MKSSHRNANKLTGSLYHYLEEMHGIYMTGEKHKIRAQNLSVREAKKFALNQELLFWLLKGRKNQLTFEIAGSEGSLAWDSEHPNDLWLGHREKPNELLIRDPSPLAPDIRSFASYPGGHNEGFPDTFKQLIERYMSIWRRGISRARKSSQGPMDQFFSALTDIEIVDQSVSQSKIGPMNIRWKAGRKLSVNPINF